MYIVSSYKLAPVLDHPVAFTLVSVVSNDHHGIGELCGGTVWLIIYTTSIELCVGEKEEEVRWWVLDVRGVVYNMRKQRAEPCGAGGAGIGGEWVIVWLDKR